MNRIRVSLPIILAGLVLAGPAAAQSTSIEGGADAAAQTPVASAEATTRAEAAADLKPARRELEEKGRHVKASARAEADARLEASARKVDDATKAEAGAVVAARLAERFDMTVEGVMTEKTALDASWGQLMIAHALEANAAPEVTVDQLVALRKDGMGWGQIAAGLDLELGSVMRAADHEGRVTSGQLRANSRVEAMKSNGARAGVGAETRASAGVGRSAAGATAGVKAGAGVGLKLGR